MEQRPKRRRRGVILTLKGLDKLQRAKRAAEYAENRGRKFTLDVLSDKTRLAVDTLMKIFACESGVDKRTLKICFTAFNLLLEREDYYHPGAGEYSLDKNQPHQEFSPESQLPEGQVPLDSIYYLERGTLELDCYKAVTRSGAFIRIKAPRKMGKTSLLMRILERSGEQNYQPVYLTLQLVEYKLLHNLDKFLRWFCANVSLAIGLPNLVTDYWDDSLGSKMNCKFYFEHYLLTHTTEPIVIGLDDIDRLFQYPDLADDFFGLLRSWHEEAKNSPIWQKLRLVVIHSTEVYIPLSLDRSPFNVGSSIELPPLTSAQILELATRYCLDWSLTEAERLISFVGGNPFLIRQALYHIGRGERTLEQILSTPATADNNIYKYHLQRQLWMLQNSDPRLIESLIKVITSNTPVELEIFYLFKLQSWGLIQYQGNLASPSCELYTRYFREYFRSGSFLLPEHPHVKVRFIKKSTD